MKRYTAFNNTRQKQAFFDDFKDAYNFAVSTLPSIEDGFTFETMKAEIEKLGTASIPERGGVDRCYCEEACIVDTTQHQVDEEGYYEW